MKYEYKNRNNYNSHNQVRSRKQMLVLVLMLMENIPRAVPTHFTDGNAFSKSSWSYLRYHSQQNHHHHNSWDFLFPGPAIVTAWSFGFSFVSWTIAFLYVKATPSKRRQRLAACLWLAQYPQQGASLLFRKLTLPWNAMRVNEYAHKNASI